MNPVTVLLVDDEPLVQASARRLLEHLGLRVVVAGSGRQAMELFRERRDEVDLVILDVVMPDMDGLECCARLRALDPALPVIFASGHEAVGPDATSERCAYLHKPYGLDELSTVIARLLRAV